MEINKKTILLNILIILQFIFFSCKNELDEVNIKYNDYYLYLVEPKNSDSPAPPIAFLNFKLENKTSNEIFFSCKSNSFDKEKSVLYILDTLNKRIINIYSSDISSVKSNHSFKIIGKIDFKSNMDYFKLKENYFVLNKDFNNTFNFEKDKKMLGEKINEMLKNSIIIYCQDTTYFKNYRLQNKNIKCLKNNVIRIEK